MIQSAGTPRFETSALRQQSGCIPRLQLALLLSANPASREGCGVDGFSGRDADGDDRRLEILGGIFAAWFPRATASDQLRVPERSLFVLNFMSHRDRLELSSNGKTPGLASCAPP